jgi:hypothetical protein
MPMPDGRTGDALVIVGLSTGDRRSLALATFSLTRKLLNLFSVPSLEQINYMVVDTLDRPLPARPRYQCCALAAVIS